MSLSRAIGDVMGSVADYMQSEIDDQKKRDGQYNEESKRKFKIVKGLQIGVATMNMLQGITAAISGLFTTKTGPWDIALAAAQATAIGVAGALNIAKIAKTNLDDSGSGSSGGASSLSVAVPTVPDFEPDRTTNITGQNETETLRNAFAETQLFVSVTDIENTQKTVKVREEESTF